MYLNHTEAQNFLIGSSREFVGFHTKVNHKVTRQIAKRAVRFYSKMTDVTIIRTYAGLRPWTENHLLIISEVDEAPGFFVAAGYEGYGISLAMITGKLIKEMMNETKATIPIEPLSINRFKKERVKHY